MKSNPLFANLPRMAALPLALIAAMALLPGCKPQKSNQPYALTTIQYHKSDGTNYTFKVTQTSSSVTTYTDAADNITLKVTTKAMSAIANITLTTQSGIISTITPAYISSVGGGPILYNITSNTPDTTAKYNLGNYGYCVATSPYYSIDTAGNPIDYYPLSYSNSTFTDSADTSNKWVYTLNVGQTHSGDYYYVDEGVSLQLWAIECAIGFANYKMSDITSFLAGRNYGVAITSETIIRGGAVQGAYAHTYAFNSAYYISEEQITDQNGGVSAVNYTYSY